MQQEQWTRWEPIENLSEKYWVESIADGIEGLTILLFDDEDRQKKVLVKFTGTTESYQRTDESSTLKRLYALHQKYGAEFITTWTFFKVLNSSYVKWLSDQSYGFMQPAYFQHFVLVTVDDVVDIIDPCEPKVEFLEEYK